MSEFIATSVCTALVLMCFEGATGFLLSPAEVGYVCQGEEIALTCTTSRNFLRWNISIPQSGYNNQRLVSALETADIVPFRINNIVLQFTRVTPDPLVIKLSISGVTVDLLVTCTELAYAYAHTLATNIHVISNQGYLAPLELVISEEFLGELNVSIILEATLMQNENIYGDLFNASFTIVPKDGQANHRFNRINRTSSELIVSYNTNYNVSTIAMVCGQTTESPYIQLIYTKCADLDFDDAQTLIVMDSRSPAIVGTTVIFSCSPGLTLTGPKTTTCMGNGEWEPDPMEIKCKADCGVPIVDDDIHLSYNSTLENSLLEFRCRSGFILDSILTAMCHKNATWIPSPAEHVCTTTSTHALGNSPIATSDHTITIAVISSVSVFILSSTLFFFLGVLCTRLCQSKHQIYRPNLDDQEQEDRIYTSVLPSIKLDHNLQFDLKKNSAYESVILK